MLNKWLMERLKAAIFFSFLISSGSLCWVSPHINVTFMFSSNQLFLLQKQSDRPKITANLQWFSKSNKSADPRFWSPGTISKNFSSLSNSNEQQSCVRPDGRGQGKSPVSPFILGFSSGSEGRRSDDGRYWAASVGEVPPRLSWGYAEGELGRS